MKKRVCKYCDGEAAGRHHKLSQSKWNRKAYPKLIDAYFNIEPACSGCHTSHAHITQEDIWNETKFRCEAYLCGHTNLGPGTKSYQNKLFRESR